MNFRLVLKILALVAFIIAVVKPTRYNLVAAGLALWLGSEIVT